MSELRLVVAAGDRERDVVVAVPDGATVRDLLATAGLPVDGPRAWVDGRPVDPDRPLDDTPVAQGCTVSTTPTPGLVTHTDDPGTCRTDDEWQVTVVAGPDTGSSGAFRPGDRLRIGRADDNDLVLRSGTVSAHHLAVTGCTDLVRVEDTGSHNGTWFDGRALSPDASTTLVPPVSLRLGADVARIDRAPDCQAPRGHDLSGPTRRVHRPPRPPLPRAVAPVVVPTAPSEHSGQALRWAGILAPLALGAAMVAMTGSLRFALFALLSPVMAVANWWSTRRRNRRAGRAASRAHAAALEQFGADLERAREQERSRREEALPALDEIVRRATEPSRRLWERRLQHEDAFLLRWGSAGVTWCPPLVGTDPPSGTSVAAPVGPVHDDEPDPTATLHDLPVPLDLGAQRVVGIAGDPDVRTGVARGLVLQATVLHGPADLAVEVATEQPCWDWLKWLPHLQPPVQPPVRPHAGDAVGGRPSAARLVVVDQPGTGGRPSPDTSEPEAVGPASARPVPPAMAIVLADHPDQLPASCSLVVEARADGTGQVLRGPDETPEELVLANAGVATARRVARALARCVDPESSEARASLPAAVSLADLVGAETAHPGDPDHLATPIGIGRDGLVEVDLVTDGPHALVAGTTGSGKSELLRTLVTGLALRHGPRDVVFVLVDYKGGSAFRDCADLPHTVGLVTDLDDHLGERALRSLRAELRHRERALAAAGADSLTAYRAAGSPGDPLPRLVVVVDEFATMASELPGFLDALVGIAQRGRSLGLHLVLATQRPRGCVDADIRANTNLRIALRVQGEVDALDVIDDARPAEIGRDLPGRAWLRRGHADLEPVQVALASAAPAHHTSSPRALPFRLGGPTTPPDGAADDDHLVRLVRMLQARAAATGAGPPRRPWLEMLAERIPLDDLREHADGRTGVLGLADLPDQQAQRPVSWGPTSGHLAVIGRRGSGTTTTLCTVLAGLVLDHPPDDVHVHVVDGGTGRWKAARALPHVGSVVAGHDHDGVDALLGWLLTEMAARRVGDQPRPRQVVLVDGLTALVDGDDPRRSTELVGRLGSILEHGPDLGVTVVAATDRQAGLPTRLRSAFSHRLVLTVDDRDLALLGLDRRDLPPPKPGRAVDPDDGTILQVAEPPSLDELARRCPGWADPPPHRVAGLPDRLRLDDLPAPSSRDGLSLPIGMARDTAPAVLHLRPGDHAIVAGPDRSGRSSALQVVSAQVRLAAPAIRQVAICDEASSPLHGWPALDACGGVDGMASLLASVGRDDRAWLVLVDDLRRWGDPAVLAGLARPGSQATLVVSGRPDDLRGPFGGWLRSVRADRTGVLLQPDLSVDGDLLGIRLPRALSTPLGPGRGYVVSSGNATLTQLAAAPSRPPSGALRAA